MHVHPRTRRALLIVAALALCAGSTAAVGTAKPSALHLGGKWTGSYSGSYSGTFTIIWGQVGSRLVGSIHLSNPNGSYRISGRVNGNAIKFGAVTVGDVCTGSVSKSGTAMSGNYVTGDHGSGSWAARKVVAKKKKKKK
jgi:hypothetical protein